MTEKMEISAKFDPQFGEQELDLLSRLSNALAVSGDEQEVRAIVYEELKEFEDNMHTDAMGNVLVTRKGSDPERIRVMIAAHMDEVGLMLFKEDGDGLFEFKVIGGVDPRQLVGKPVIIGRDHVPGVIGAKAIHLTTKEEREQVLKVESLRVDVGLGGSKLVNIGDRATFATSLAVLGPSLRGKALDDRLGVFNLIQLLKNAPENIDLLAAFTVQEELGLRGAKVAAYHFNPDIGLAMDSTPANDMPDFDGEPVSSYNTKLDGGPAIYLMDGATIGDHRLVKWLTETADAEGIPWQYRQPGKGGTDAGSIHKTRSGVPSVSVSVPQRYLHSAAGMVRIADELNTLKLMHAALSRLDKTIINPQERN
ncbi:MAG TPA: M42 family metallopeptidase [Chloroflexi bacterium]|nr:M42 family metallopeptidase [Chloroflexota bacterium]